MRPAIARLAPLVMLALPLAGCGEVHPGAAAVFDDETVSVETVDDAAQVLCTVDPSTSDLATARRRALDLLLGSRLIERFGAERGALPSDGQVARAPQVANAEQDAEGLPEEIRDAYVTTVTAVFAAQATLTNVGLLELGAQGVDIDPQQAAQAGSAAYAAWLADGAPEVDVDPRFGTWEPGGLIAGDASLSVAQSRTAKQFERGAAELPASQLCSSAG